MRLDIKDQLEKAGITRYKLAQLLNVTYPTITKMYNGDATSINLNTLEQLCLSLNCSPNDILVFEDSNNIYEKYPSLKKSPKKYDGSKDKKNQNIKSGNFVAINGAQKDTTTNPSLQQEILDDSSFSNSDDVEIIPYTTTKVSTNPKQLLKSQKPFNVKPNPSNKSKLNSTKKFQGR